MRIALLLFLLLAPTTFAAQEPAQSSYVRAEVEQVFAETDAAVGGTQRTVQDAALRLLSGPEAGRQVLVENPVLNNRSDMRLRPGETVVLQRILRSDGTTEYVVREKYRLRALLLLAAAFLLLGVLCGGRTGVAAIGGLLVSVGVLVFFVVPQIMSGTSPLSASLAGAVLIACTSLYIAHGFNRRTTIALLSTCITLAATVLLAVVFVHFAKLFGMGTEESVFLQLGPLRQVDLRGLLLGGIIIGALGVLDDITTAQTAAVDELSRANPKLGFRALYRAGTSIGREHIASLINTLALAYVGASLPLLLLFSTGTDVPFWVTLNSEFLAEEIVRTLVGSSALLLAVPVSTWLAARSFAHGRHTTVRGHAHLH